MDNFIYRNYISSLTVFYIREANLNQIFTQIQNNCFLFI